MYQDTLQIVNWNFYYTFLFTVSLVGGSSVNNNGIKLNKNKIKTLISKYDFYDMSWFVVTLFANIVAVSCIFQLLTCNFTFKHIIHQWKYCFYIGNVTCLHANVTCSAKVVCIIFVCTSPMTVQYTCCVLCWKDSSVQMKVCQCSCTRLSYSKNHFCSSHTVSWCGVSEDTLLLSRAQ